MLALAAGPATAQDQGASNEYARNNEIIVTASKREERLKDVALPVTALGGEDLLENNQTRAQEFFSSVPGLNLQFQNNRSQLAIRGITTSPVTGNPVVGFTIDDVPYGSSTGQGGLFGSAPDLDPSELARIEVLRGPQGTLYGAASIGGLIKYVTVDPDLSGFSGAVAGGVNMIRFGGQTLGYNARGSVNVPLGETVALRASAFTREDPGYIDNVRSGLDDVNSTRVSGGRVSALWKPSDVFSLKLSALYQLRDLFGSANVDVSTGNRFEQTDQIGAGRARAENQIYSAVATGDLGAVELTSVTGYSRSKNYDFVDFTTTGLTAFVFPVVFPGVTDFGHVLRQGYDVDKFSQELRVAGKIGPMIDWIVGGFYTHEDGTYTIDTNATNPATGAVFGVPVIWRDTLDYDEWAAFGNATIRFSDQFDVQLGGRYSENRQALRHREFNLFGPGTDADRVPIATDPKARGSAFTYQISPRFKPSDDHMIYGRIASGYRPGGPNANCNTTSVPPVPCQFRPDETVNYEVGAKGDLFGRLLSYDLSIYHIDWTDIQITQIVGANGFTFNTNAGKARSRGAEIAFESQPADGLSIKMWGAYTDATLRDSFQSDAVFAAKGDRLPYSSKYSGRFSMDYTAAISDEVTGSIGGSVTYVGNRKGEFVFAQDVANLRQTYPGYAQVDVNAGLEFSQWTVNLFVQNLTDKRGLNGGGFYNQTSFNDNWFNFTQPRTVGLNIAYNF